MFGGQSSISFNDLRQLDPYKWEWTTLKADNIGHDIHKRFGHSLNAYKNSLITFGGGGSYLQKLKRRETYNDVFMYEIASDQWINIGESSQIIQGNSNK
jgi:hypothetical protein